MHYSFSLIAPYMKKILSKNDNIAVTGIARGGKTVFLTSLLAQLEEFDQADFSFAGNSKIEAFKELRTRSDFIRQFPLDRYRDFLAMRGSWPEKTSDAYCYSCEYWRSDWKFWKQRLNFFDFPGERIADSAIAAVPDYRKWSEHILSHLKNHKSLFEDARGYFEILENPSAPLEEIIFEYKLTLARLILNFKPLITPSTFLLSKEGITAKKGSVNELASQRASGLDFDSEFVPLSREYCEQNPEYAERMHKNFRLYRRNVVMPLYRELGKCRKLIVLIDLPTLLAGGVGQYNDNRQILQDLFQTLRPDSSIGRKLASTIKFWQRPLEKVAFAASKADMIYNDDIENGTAEGLLRQLTSKARKIVPEAEYRWFVCSACQSSVKGEKPYTLRGRPARNNPEKQIVEFEVPRLPENWPDSWQPGDYRFKALLPEVPKNTQKPPRHINLDAVFDFIAN
ncbi:YcjX family protein [Sedimentisphaera salicampi]|nr:YcjX family protein [Sedimentisphaera salicampi]